MDTQEPKTYLLFSYAFRSLFLLAVLQALIGISLWLVWWTGAVSIEWRINPVFWHGHEMAVGFAGAAIGGFLLTAVATWTGRPAVRGWPLALLCALWLVARLGPVFPLLAAAGGVLYWLWLLLLMAREVVTVRNQRNYKVLLLLFIFMALEALYHYAEMAQAPWQRQALWSQIWLVLMMINLIGGRIIPAFTRNWLLKQHPEYIPAQLPGAFNALDVAAGIALALFAVASLLPLPTELFLLLAVAAAVLQAWRLWRWQGFRTLAEPLVWMLHLSYAWIPLGVLLFGLGLAGYISGSAGIHTLTIGTVAGMIVSVSARAALGHTGRPLASHPLLNSTIVLLALATLTRVGAALFNSDFMMTIAAVFWLCGFFCFALRYVPVLVRPGVVPPTT
ncbi:MAG: NnrS family protein [Pseudohongiellaceae bacterium]